MNSVRIWINARQNRLHLVFPAALSEAEVDSASLRLQVTIKQLRPGFSITVSHELGDPDRHAKLPTARADRFAAARRRAWVNRVLRVVDDRLVA